MRWVKPRAGKALQRCDGIAKPHAWILLWPGQREICNLFDQWGSAGFIEDFPSFLHC